MTTMQAGSRRVMRRSGLLVASAFAVLPFTTGAAAAATLTVDPAGGADHTTIAAAVAAAAPGDTIQCAAGVYPNAGNSLVNLNKSLILRGAQAGVDARTRGPGGVPGGETVLAATGRIFDLNAAGITIDGFFFQDIRGRGIDTYYSPADDIVLRNNIFQSTTGTYSGGAIQFGGGATLQANGFVFEQNYTQNLGGYLLYMGHAMDGGRIADNYINGDSLAFGPFGDRTGWVIEGNVFDGDVPGFGPHYGYGINANLGDVVIRDNVIRDMYVGLGQISVVNGEITNNRFENNQYAAVQLWGGEWGSVVSTEVEISNNYVSYNGLPYPSGDFANASHGFRLRPGLDASTIHINGNTFVDLGVGEAGAVWAVRNNGNGVLDAEFNDWGSTDPAVIASRVGQSAETPDTDPYLAGATYTGGLLFEAPNNVLLAATIATSAGPSAGVPVTFLVDGEVVGSGVTDAAGVASFDAGALAVGSYAVEAVAAPDAISATASVGVYQLAGPTTLRFYKANVCAKTAPVRNGKVKVLGVIDDSDTGGVLRASLLAGSALLEVRAGAFDLVVPVAGCEERRAGGAIKCSSVDGTHAVVVKFAPLLREGPNRYRMTARVNGVTTTAVPSAPVEIRIGQGTTLREDSIPAMACVQRPDRAQLACRESVR